MGHLTSNNGSEKALETACREGSEGFSEGLSCSGALDEKHGVPRRAFEKP